MAPKDVVTLRNLSKEQQFQLDDLAITVEAKVDKEIEFHKNVALVMLVDCTIRAGHSWEKFS